MGLAATEPREIQLIQKSRRSAEHRYAWRLEEWEFQAKVRAGLSVRLLGELALEGEGVLEGATERVDGGARTKGIDAAVAALRALEEWGADVDADRIAAFETKGSQEGPDRGESAALRADLWGYVAPGKPSMAAELAWRDLSPFHEGSSLYAGMFVAATASAAFVADDALEALFVGLGELPDESRLSREIQAALKVHRTSSGWSEAKERLREEAPSSLEDRASSALAHSVLALLFGRGNPFDSWRLLAEAGLAGAALYGAIGSIIGVRLGGDREVPDWLQGVPERLLPRVAGLGELTLDALAARIVAAAKRLPRR